MYAVTLMNNVTKEVLELVGFVSSKDEFDQLVDRKITEYGACWLGDNDLVFGLELAC